MNLFFLDIDPETAATENCDKHVVKIPTEAAQMLYTVHALINSNPRWRESAPPRVDTKTGARGE